MCLQGEGNKTEAQIKERKENRTNQKGKKMTTITINDKNHTIELSKTFAKAASLFGSVEYNQLQVARRDYPHYRVITMKQKSTRKDVFANMSFAFMDKYVKEHADDTAKAEYLNLRGLKENWDKDENGIPADYQSIKDWFLSTFKEFEEFQTKRQGLLDKIQREKKARLERLATARKQSA